MTSVPPNHAKSSTTAAVLHGGRPGLRDAWALSLEEMHRKLTGELDDTRELVVA